MVSGARALLKGVKALFALVLLLLLQEKYYQINLAATIIANSACTCLAAYIMRFAGTYRLAIYTPFPRVCSCPEKLCLR